MAAGTVTFTVAPPVRQLPDDGKWTYEAKLDGYRCLVAKREGGRASQKSIS